MSAAAILVACVAAAPGALAFLTFQRERGTEVESLGGARLPRGPAFRLARAGCS